ncbi:auxilin-like clathrin-binding protein required for normal clathrin function [Ophidiomyces ophidiicola]|nr:auxilin-like clathrin-binding protein required for normal clathrin function [Ophidiomyces ophidiicola]KAI1928903.1 auxilin-like clathrin-binding protein required for normal clathrin function [Ophidiomyces ophidiicola]KAI1956310.1 auxilin-like clathrin-binding protein required for normal clathrin function [Ophidiomyces ophidiicola]KAI2038113.1 auxilin-like clathrin-binding protein required for normal clathrin function [Ophidiomyces ophidiicola]KAI2100434.1 auxilin-like clathrin-binding protei
MDDLSGLNWTGNSESQRRLPVSDNLRAPNARLTPPISGRSTPLAASAPRTASPSQPLSRTNDSFANLVNFGSGAAGKNLSLAERQKQLAEQKALEERKKQEQLTAQYGGNNDQFWDKLERPAASNNPFAGGSVNGNGTTSAGIASPSRDLGIEEDEDDILAAFNSSAPVDKSTNFPIPSSTASPAPIVGLQELSSNDFTQNEDDDPFGLGNMGQKKTQPSQPINDANDDDDDILGLLGKPVSEFASPPTKSPSHGLEAEHTPDGQASTPASTTPVDRAIAELVDMGFPIEKASQALATTESGTDVQAAVGWLLNTAHAEAREKARGRSHSAQAQARSERTPNGHRDRFTGDLRDASLPSRVRRQDNLEARSQRKGSVDKDAAQMASEFGNNFLKSANSLWKSGTKRMQQAVQDFNSTPNPSQPRWMTESPSEREKFQEGVRKAPSRAVASENGMTVTDEAMLLEMERAPSSKPQRPTRTQTPSHPVASQGRLREFSPAEQQRTTTQQPRQAKQSVRGPPVNESRARLSRLAAVEQASQAYVSPARRRKASPQVFSEAEPDLLEGSSKVTRAPPEVKQQPQPSRPRTSPPVVSRPKAPPRQIPQISPSSLSSSHRHRQEGTAAFKRGDYATAHASYSSAISLLPTDHPITIVLLTNHALTALKIGEPKTAIVNADRALSIIGPCKGESEHIDFGNGEPQKEMKEFFGKAMMRKAEALEQLEKWNDAAVIWREALEAGHGGSTSIQGRTRCEKAASSQSRSSPSTQSTPPARPPPRKTPVRTPRAPVRPAVSTKPAEAVSRLREANEAADRLDNEKFALADTVEARLTAWKGGKQDNLRALLASLDTVLWSEAGWKKLSMAELVLPNKVKIHYMKGISKVHPDKIPVNATTEQRMIAGAVFSTLNEAWDKFKQENGL